MSKTIEEQILEEEIKAQEKEAARRAMDPSAESDGQDLVDLGVSAARGLGRAADYAAGIPRAVLAQTPLLRGIQAMRGKPQPKASWLLDALRGEAPSANQMRKQMEIPDGPRLSDMPGGGGYVEPGTGEWWQAEKGGMLDPSLGEAGAMGVDIATDPLSHAGLLGAGVRQGGKALRPVASALQHAAQNAAEDSIRKRLLLAASQKLHNLGNAETAARIGQAVSTPVTEGANAGGKKLYDSAFVDHNRSMAENIPGASDTAASDFLYSNGVRGTRAKQSAQIDSLLENEEHARKGQIIELDHLAQQQPFGGSPTQPTRMMPGAGPHFDVQAATQAAEASLKRLEAIGVDEPGMLENLRGLVERFRTKPQYDTLQEINDTLSAIYDKTRGQYAATQTDPARINILKKLGFGQRTEMLNAAKRTEKAAGVAPNLSAAMERGGKKLQNLYEIQPVADDLAWKAEKTNTLIPRPSDAIAASAGALVDGTAEGALWGYAIKKGLDVLRSPFGRSTLGYHLMTQGKPVRQALARGGELLGRRSLINELAPGKQDVQRTPQGEVSNPTETYPGIEPGTAPEDLQPSPVPTPEPVRYPSSKGSALRRLQARMLPQSGPAYDDAKARSLPIDDAIENASQPDVPASVRIYQQAKAAQARQQFVDQQMTGDIPPGVGVTKPRNMEGALKFDSEWQIMPDGSRRLIKKNERRVPPNLYEGK